jgi:Plant mobile domain
MLDKNGYHNPLHVGVKYVRVQLIMLPHTLVNWRPYESVRHLLPTCVDDCVDLYTCRLSLIYLPVVEWYYPERVRRQFGLLQSVPPPLHRDHHLIPLMLDQHYFCHQYYFSLRSYQYYQLSYSQI